MFEDALLDSSPRRASGLRRVHYLTSAFAAESLLVGVLILVPLIYTQALPKQLLFSCPHIFPPPGPLPARLSGRPSPQVRHTTVDPLAAPIVIPPITPQIVEAPAPPQFEDGPAGPFVPGAPGGPGGGNGYIPGGIGWDIKAPPPPPPVAHTPPKPQVYRIGGDVIAARALNQPPPVYPPLATMVRIQGTVVLEAIIGKDGAIQNLKVLSGHPLLVRAALDAVKTWRYQPTLLNSEPVDVLTEIEVKFNLSD